MENKDSRPGDAPLCRDSGEQSGQALRRQAEELARKKGPLLQEHPDALSPEETRRMLHELRVYQLELEMQNDELKRSQWELEASRDRYFNFYDLSPVGYFTLSEQGLILEVNLTAANLLGAPKSALIRQQLTRFILPEDQNSYYRHIKKLIETGEHQSCELRMGKKDGAPFWVRLESNAVQDGDGNPINRIVMSDITEQKRAEEALRNSEAHLRTLVKNIPDLIWLKDKSGVYIDCNPMFERFFGAAKKDIIGKTDFDFVDRELAEIFREHDRMAVAAGKPCHKEDWITFADDGYRGLFDTIKTPMLDAEVKLVGVLGIARDITERKLAEEQKAKLEARLMQAQKMESIGSLAGGIAHDLNNILFPISGLSEMLLDEMSPGTSEHESLAQIHKSAQRGSDLVKQILAFSRQSNPRKLPIRIQPILEEVLKLTRATVPRNIEITSHIKPDCGLVSADPSQVHQILMNLITNAYHAVEGSGGMIHIALKEADSGWNISAPLPAFGEKGESPFHPMPGDLLSGKYACITVYDTGTGIDQTLIDKIFEPYFTTKEQGKGTGLGLSVVHGIVKEHGGDIRVYSEFGKGTTFNVYLPLLKSAGDGKTVASPEKYPTGRESILLVDDEAPIVHLMQKMLEKLGYQVTARTSSPDALALFSADPLSFDLVICDRGMPNMTGEQLAGELISIKPGIPVIICTGFSDATDEQRGRAMGIKGYLMKPVAAGDLAAMVRNVLDGVPDSVSANAPGQSVAGTPTEGQSKEKGNG
ncbi:MAG: PAS domain S-box protein [Pseudomonadota bacterium]